MPRLVAELRARGQELGLARRRRRRATITKRFRSRAEQSQAGTRRHLGHDERVRPQRAFDSAVAASAASRAPRCPRGPRRPRRSPRPGASDRGLRRTRSCPRAVGSSRPAGPGTRSAGRVVGALGDAVPARRSGRPARAGAAADPRRTRARTRARPGSCRGYVWPRRVRVRRPGLRPPTWSPTSASVLTRRSSCGRTTTSARSSCAFACAAGIRNAASARQQAMRIRHTLWPVAERNFVKFTFFKVRPEWRRRTADERAQDKREFAAALEEFARDHFLRTYSLVGTRGDADLMVRAVASSLDPIHELHVLINQSGLMRWADTPYSYLAMTKESVYSDEPTPLEPRPGSDSRYLFVYPMWKKREWYALAPRGADADHEGPHRDRPRVRRDRDQHRLLLRPGRSGVRRVVQRRRPGRVPRSRAGAAGYGVEPLHAARHAHLHVHLARRRLDRRPSTHCETTKSATSRSSAPAPSGWSRRSGRACARPARGSSTRCPSSAAS